MATSAKVNLKNMDYFKFRKYVIDGNRDETSSCSKEVASLCACVQTLNFRDDEFDAGGQDWERFDEICAGYRQILQGKRVEPLDMRIKSGWWGEQRSGLSAGKIKAALLQEVLVSKTKDWLARHGEIARTSKSEAIPLEKAIEGPGVYVFKHKERSCFQLVQNANNIFQRCSDFLKSTFEGSLSSPLAALIVVSLVSDWDFYFVPVAVSDSEEILRVIENDLVLKHDTIWPHGLNLTLTLQTTFDVIQFRRSCIRHRWPPERDFKKNIPLLNVDEIRNENYRAFSLVSPTSTNPPLSPPAPQISERPCSAKSPAAANHNAAAVHPKTTRPSTASKAHAEQKKIDHVCKSNLKSSTKQNSSYELNKSHLPQSNKDKKEVKREAINDSVKKLKSKENKSPESNGKQEWERKEDSCGSPADEKNSKKSTNSEDEFSPQPLKRSNTFTYEESGDTTETANEGQSSKLPQRATEAARRLAAQTQ